MAREVIEVPMAGKILSVNVKVGDKVQEGDTLSVLESMKMENPLVAPISGEVTEISVKTGDMVEAGQALAVIEG
jgi:biotin carboxyl carrier protein